MAPRILLREDVDVSHLALESLQADGVQVLTGHKALRCESAGDTEVHRGAATRAPSADRIRRIDLRRGPQRRA
jgi:pyruvate/2-oxoglutarate dehydrogenase complex dihydrolipoamide dehydrogenase (E3) component